MPLYDYHCSVCGQTHERLQSMNESHTSMCCGVLSKRVWPVINFTDVYTGRYEPALRQYVGTKTERRRLMSERNLIDYPYDN